MLLMITEKCNMGCSHCMDDCKPTGEHLSMETFEKVVRFLKWVKPKVILVTGGEPTESPHLFDMVKRLSNIMDKKGVCITSNGMFLENTEMTERVLKLGVSVQITNDIRYYPQRINMSIKSKYLLYETNIRSLYPQGRAKGMQPINCSAPKCFNLRGIAINNVTTFKDAINIMEMKVHKVCEPSIDINGNLRGGESVFCGSFGNVTMSDAELLQSLKDFKCDNCGMTKNLSVFHKKHINI